MKTGRLPHNENEKPRPRSGLRRKITLLICLSTLTVVLIGSTMEYFWMTSVISKAVRESQLNAAGIVSAFIVDMIDEQIEQVKVFTTRPLVRKAIEESNLKYSQMSREDIERYFADMDAKWIGAPVDSPLVKEYAGNKISMEHLMPEVKENNELVEMFITDKLGGLVASSEKTTDFYQADERWWQAASEGNIFIGNVELDESSNTLGVTIATPIMDDDREVIGICKAVFDAQKLFSSLDVFKLGTTGHAALIDDQGMIIFHKGVRPLSVKALSGSTLNRILNKSSSFEMMAERVLHHADVFATFKKVEHVILSKNGIVWFVTINQEVKEVFAPLNNLTVAMLMFFGIAILIMVPMGFISGGYIVRPIKRIVDGMLEIGKGNLDYKISVKTNDEMEYVAEALNSMTVNLKSKTASIELLNHEIDNRMKVEEALKLSAKFLQLLIDAIPTPIFYKNSKRVFVGCNIAFEKFMGIKRQSIIGRASYDILPRKFTDISREQDEKFTPESSIAAYEYQMESADGSSKDLIVNRAQYRDPVTGDIGTISVLFDITERKNIEDAIQHIIEIAAGVTGEPFFNNLVSSLAKWFGLDIVIAGNLINGGKAASAISMYSMDKVTHDYVYPLVGTPCGEAIKVGYTTYDSNVSKLFPADKDLAGVKAEGYVGLPIRDIRGEAVGILCGISSKRLQLPPYAEDVLGILAGRAAMEIERSRSEEIIASAAKEWQKTFDSITDMVFIQDKDFAIIKANKVFAAAMNMKAGDIIGKKCHQVVHRDKAPWPNCPFEKTIRDNQAHTEEVDDPHIGIPLLVTTSPIFDKDGKLAGSIHIAKDISEMKKAREELERKNTELRKLDQLKSDFISTVSHELRTPLSIIKEGISLVLDNVPGKINEKQDHILTTAKDNINRLARVIDSLLDISKIEAGKVTLNKTKFNIKDMVVKTAYSFVPKAREKGLEIKAVIPDKDIYVYADADRITQVFVNLIGNAIKFTKDGRVDVSVEDKGDIVECSVADTGIGISAENLPKLFDKFQQFARLAGPGDKGTGLGLAISKNIMDLHKGRLWVESEPGKGSKFTFTLPKE